MVYPKGYSAGNYLFKVINRNTRTKCEICLKLTMKTPKRRCWRRFGVFNVNYEDISHLCSSVSIANFEQVNTGWVVFSRIKIWFSSVFGPTNFHDDSHNDTLRWSCRVYVFRWVNRKDPEGRNIFSGGFLGLDNIGNNPANINLFKVNNRKIRKRSLTSFWCFYC